jgi:hypothetical protein
MKSQVTKTGYLVHDDNSCRCLCHTKRCIEIKGLCACEIEARKQLSIPLDAKIPLPHKYRQKHQRIVGLP